MHIRSLMLGSILAMSTIAFAAADKSGSGAPKPAPIPPTGGGEPPTPAPIPPTGGGEPAVAAPATGKAAPVITDIVAGIPMPEKRSGGRTGHTIYPFDKLEVGQSFGVKDKTAKNMASTVSSANDRYIEDVKDGDGNVIMIDNPKKAGEKMKATKQTRHFVSASVDPKTDPAGASVRIWRDA